MGYEYVQEADAWLRLHIVPADWQDARLRCHLEGGVLTSPTSSALTKAMIAIMAANQVTMRQVFTGIQAVVARGHFMTIDGIPLSNLSLRWADNEPNNANNNEDCLVMNSEGEVADVNCANVYPFFCTKKSSKMTVNKCGNTDNEKELRNFLYMAKEPAIKCRLCTTEYHLEPRIGSCYKFHQVPRTWHQAAAACFSEGGHLAIINSPIESQVLKELFAKYPENTLRVKYPHVAMIGFWDWNEHARNGEWFTIFGETLTDAGFSTWAPNEPNNAFGIEFCGSIVRDGLLNDFECNTTAVFICEITRT
ncbi:C-type lectin domain family 10 member A-like [Cydia splendana]|uniref:C-type lectin domain family 10 member A-like n=1 Tax=Cydia splendana TaxID=1100963 RepID=UPI00300D4E60